MLVCFAKRCMKFTFREFQREKACFAANALGARGALLSVLVHFFEHGRWGSLVETHTEGQSLNSEDQLFILMQAALYLTATRGLASVDAHFCYERAESLCHSLNRPQLLYPALIGQWRYSLNADKLTATIQIAKRVYSLARKQKRISFGTLAGELVKSIVRSIVFSAKNRIDKEAGENHVRDESWQFLICLKMAGFVPAKKGASGGSYAIFPPTSINVTTAKEFDPSAGESAFLFPPVCLHAGTSLRNDFGPLPIRSKFTACAYHVNNFADLLLAIAGVMRQFSSRSRQIKKIRL
jgi:hypothetical protein